MEEASCIQFDLEDLVQSSLDVGTYGVIHFDQWSIEPPTLDKIPQVSDLSSIFDSVDFIEAICELDLPVVSKYVSTGINYLSDAGFDCANVIADAAGSNMFSALELLASRREDLYFRGERVIDVKIPVRGLPFLPATYFENMSIMRDGHRILVSGKGHHSLMGVIDNVTPNEAVVVVVEAGGEFFSLMLTELGISAVSCNLPCYFVYDFRGKLLKLSPYDIECDFSYLEPVVFDVPAPTASSVIVIVDGQYFLCVDDPLVSLKRVTKNVEVTDLEDSKGNIHLKDVDCSTNWERVVRVGLVSHKIYPNLNALFPASWEVVNAARASPSPKRLYPRVSRGLVDLKWTDSNCAISSLYDFPYSVSSSLSSKMNRKGDKRSLQNALASLIHENHCSLTLDRAYFLLQFDDNYYCAGRGYPKPRMSRGQMINYAMRFKGDSKVFNVHGLFALFFNYEIKMRIPDYFILIPRFPGIILIGRLNLLLKFAEDFGIRKCIRSVPAKYDLNFEPSVHKWDRMELRKFVD
jgi:hypothetical protein